MDVRARWWCKGFCTREDWHWDHIPYPWVWTGRGEVIGVVVEGSVGGGGVMGFIAGRIGHVGVYGLGV